MSTLTKHQTMLRERCLRDAQWLVAHQLIESYNMKRPYDRPKYPPTRPFSGDCSGTIKLLWEWMGGGVQPMDGQPWGYGNTSTMVVRGYHVPDLAHANPMDLCFYGNPWAGGSGAHVTMLTHLNKGHWMAFSMGGNSGPNYVRATYRKIVAIRRYKLPAK